MTDLRGAPIPVNSGARCDCPACRAWTWAIRISMLMLVALIVAAVAAMPAHAAEVPVQVCARLPLPGPEHVLNPNDPPARQVRETVLVCETVTVPEREINPVKRSADYRRDPRSFA